MTLIYCDVVMSHPFCVTLLKDSLFKAKRKESVHHEIINNVFELHCLTVHCSTEHATEQHTGQTGVCCRITRTARKEIN
jgi:hypothetical protein